MSELEHGLTDAELEAQDGADLPDKEAMSLISTRSGQSLLNLDVDLALDADVAAPIDAAVAANANVAAPIDAAVAANIASVGFRGGRLGRSGLDHRPGP